MLSRVGFRATSLVAPATRAALRAPATRPALFATTRLHTVHAAASIIAPTSHIQHVVARIKNAPRGVDADQLSTEAIKLLLAERLETADKSELLDMLQSRLVAKSEADRINVFERVAPSVAFISTGQPTQRGLFPVGAGSGFVWDTDGHVITNYHVVAGRAPGGRGLDSAPRKVMVKLQGHEAALEARVVGYEADKDIAVLKVDTTTLPGPLQPVELASSSDLKVGQSVLAIGAPFGLDWTLTSGIVSALGRDIDGAGGRPIRDCIQTDAAINPGNSGGPLLDSSGRLLGVNTMIYTPNGVGANVGIGFAVPSDTVQRFVRQIINHGPNARPSLGVGVLPDQLREEYARQLRRELEGALIAEVVPGGPAESRLAPCGPSAGGRGGGIVLGDLITAVNGAPVKRNEDLLVGVEESEQEAPIKLTVMRGCDPAKVEEVEILPIRRQGILDLEKERAEREVAKAKERAQRDGQGGAWWPWDRIR